MHPMFSERMMRDNERELERRVRNAYARQPAPAVAPPHAEEHVLLRLCTVHDVEALEQLAALEGRPALSGSCVLAEVGGKVVAALPLGGGPAIADPFRPTAHLVHLLELRAGQLRVGRSARRAGALWGAIRSLSRA